MRGRMATPSHSTRSGATDWAEGPKWLHCQGFRLLWKNIAPASNSGKAFLVCSCRNNVCRRLEAGFDTGEIQMKMTIRGLAARLGVVAVCSAALCSAPLLAQGGGGGMRMSPDDQVAAIDKAVTLTDEQKPKVKSIIEADQKKMQDLFAAQDPDMREKMTKMRADENTQIKALLTDDQKTKYDAYVASMPRRGGGGPPPAQ